MVKTSFIVIYISDYEKTQVIPDNHGDFFLGTLGIFGEKIFQIREEQHTNSGWIYLFELAFIKLSGL